MKIALPTQHPGHAGSALVLTMMMSAIGIGILAGAMQWSMNSNKLTHRSVQYALSVAAAEAATEKAISQFTRDFQVKGEAEVQNNLANYRTAVPTASDSSYWSSWAFDNGTGQTAKNYVQTTNSTTYVVLNSAYAGLRGFVRTQTVVSHARNTASKEIVVAGVFQKLQLASIPIFQFAMYSSGHMEISCGQPFNITGRVHANEHLYVEPDSALTFESDVTAVGDIHFARHPLDPRDEPVGTVVYQDKKAGVGAMNLPIGSDSNPNSIREILQVPPIGEDHTSPLGKARYYNQANIILTVTDLGISATSGRANNFATPILLPVLTNFVTTSKSFTDKREGKKVRPIDLDVGKFATLNIPVIGPNASSIYVVDKRNLPATELGGVRVVNGRHLGPKGLTVATARPLYVLGHYNQLSVGHLGTSNTQNTRPASLVADAVTILSENWKDTNSTAVLSARDAAPTTVNAAILTGVVETTASAYSGGMENFLRFLEDWGAANPLTYNGSMVKMFRSRYATNQWGTSGVYNPPKRNWAYDLNFEDATKLPPLTPTLRKVIRSQWATVAPNSNVAAATY